ncbi:polysaccharide pyruvyl transferase family protein [Neobacillus terrae]|uniref:polysaccharide pyruvyl transferase family protein n=1 Tax=Neobacillus terrae TaxID=3034837 RepID=UPI001409EDFC|nr:polysaccharide pyruvyl transferase family protein [Neobacillus terrae]NHM29993.1 polysaccharide pyruvyl transferase family protein [Neobacillus terrae]
MYTNNKKIAVDAYFFNNFGDDLFLEILINRYPDAYFDFITPSKDRIKNFIDNPRINRVNRKHALINAKSYDMYIMIGGSMFQQPPNWKMQWLNLYLMIRTFKLFNKKTAIIGCNFGPYSNPSYLTAYKYLFKNLNYMSVRDEKSFSILNEKNINIHSYPDMAFSFDTEPYQKYNSDEKEKCIGVSIMDFGKENIDYENKMADIVGRLQKNSRVKIFSFQNSNEINDLNIIKKVLSKIEGDKENIEVINYDGNIQRFLNDYAQCSSFLTTRFHSLILSITFNQKIIAINYNPKIENTLKFLQLENINLIELNDMEGINPDHLLDNSKVNYNMKDIKDKAIAHFQYIDSVIGINK